MRNANVKYAFEHKATQNLILLLQRLQINIGEHQSFCFDQTIMCDLAIVQHMRLIGSVSNFRLAKFNNGPMIINFQYPFAHCKPSTAKRVIKGR